MRGIFNVSETLYLSIRFNPAYAGNINSHCALRYKSKVQPRVCGEYEIVDYKGVIEPGSTPRMRGIFRLAKFKRGCYQVQPRVCGEYLYFDSRYRLSIGSTPRMRGILIMRLERMYNGRFNPAYAGNILSSVAKW